MAMVFCFTALDYTKTPCPQEK